MIARAHLWSLCLLSLAACQKTESSADARRSHPPNNATAAGDTPQATRDAGSALPTSGHQSAQDERSLFTTRKVVFEGRTGYVVEGRSTPDKLWVPPDTVLAEFEGMFPESAPGNQKDLKRIDKYVRQYWGRERAPNQHEIEVDFLCEAPKDIDHKPYMGFDGLGCHTVVFYCPETRQIEVQGQDLRSRPK